MTTSGTIQEEREETRREEEEKSCERYSPARSCREPRALVCLGVFSMWGRKLEAAASRVSAPITAIATPIPMATVLACHQALGMSQKLKSNIVSIVAVPQRSR